MTARRRLSAGRSAFAVALAALFAALAAPPAEATMVISGQATKNVQCKNGICKATGHFAILNAGDLTGMLAAGDVTVVPGTRALDIDIKVPLSWASASRLTLDAYHSIFIDRTLTVAGPGALTMTTNDGGSGGDLFFEGKGRAIFWDLASSLIINGTHHTLVGDIATLASDIAAHPALSFALANNYDAGVDGTYGATPIPTTFYGAFDGLGNTISNLTLSTSSGSIALLASANGRFADLRLTHAHATNTGTSSSNTALLAVVAHNLVDDRVSGTISAACCAAGGMLVDVRGSVARSSANVRITGTPATAGGLAAEIPNGGGIAFSHADGDVTGTINAGGLIGETSFLSGGGELIQDFATGKVTGGQFAGGLVGYLSGHAQNSYATGAVSANEVGGFVGVNDSDPLDHDYAIGHVQGPAGDEAGGFSGCDQFTASFDYWDTDTAGVNVGNGGSDGRCTETDTPIGLTTAQFQSGLPNGFDPAIWAEDPSINNGFPYLIANPPQ
jgi:hypothetical protein